MKFSVNKWFIHLALDNLVPIFLSHLFVSNSFLVRFVGSIQKFGVSRSDALREPNTMLWNLTARIVSIGKAMCFPLTASLGDVSIFWAPALIE